MGGLPVTDPSRKPVGYINRDTSLSTRIPMDKIGANPFQPRVNFDAESLEELAESIKTLGLIQPITVRSIGDGKYQIISGERRFRACRMAGMETIPAYVREADDQGMLEMALVENIQRQDLDPIETALSYQRLIDECSLTQEQMAERVGKNRATVANTLRLLKLPAKVQHDLKLGLISAGHAKALLGTSDPELQEKFCNMVISEGLSVRELEALVREAADGIPKPKRPILSQAALPESYDRLIGYIGKYFSHKVAVRRSASGKGSMTIRFDSDEEVERFLTALDESRI